MVFVPKCAKEETAKQCRRLTVANHLKKLYEIMLLQLRAEVADREMLPSVYGFRKGRQAAEVGVAAFGSSASQVVFARAR